MTPDQMIAAANRLQALVERVDRPDSAALAAYIRDLEAVMDAAVESEALVGLGDVAALVLDGLVTSQQSGGTMSADAWAAYRAWPGLLTGYLAAPGTRQSGEALIAWLRQPAVEVGLSDADAEMMQGLLGTKESQHAEVDFDLGSDSAVGAFSESAELSVFLGFNDETGTFTDASDRAHTDSATADFEPFAEASATSATQVAVTAGADATATGVDDTRVFDANDAANAAHAATAAGHGTAVHEFVEEVTGDGDDEALAAEIEAEFASHTIDDSLRATMDMAATLEHDLILEVAPPPADSAIAEVSDVTRELIELLRSEFDEIAAVVEVSALEDMTPTEQVSRLGDYATQLERFSGACDVGGFAGLKAACLFVKDNTAECSQADAAALVGATDSFNTAVGSYLDAPRDPATAQTLMEQLSGAGWPRPLDGELRSTLGDLLGRPELDDEDLPPPRPTVATAEDVSLTLPADVNPDLLEGLLSELPTLAESFSATVQQLMSGRGTAQDIDVAQRVAHTLKGAGNTVGVVGVANLTHHLEDILLAFKNHELLPGGAVADILMTASDCLEAMSEYLSGTGAHPDDAQAVLQQVLDLANRVDREGAEALADTAPAPAAQPPEAAAAVPAAAPPATAAAAAGAPPAAAGAAAAPAAATETPLPEAAAPATAPAAVPAHGAMLRVSASLIDDMLRLVGETIILTGQVHDRLRRSEEQTRALQAQFDVLRSLGAELEQQIDLQDISASLQRDNDDTDFDPLEMEQYNELHTIGRRLVEAATDAYEMGQSNLSQLDELDEMMTSQERLNKESEAAVLRTRMVPVGNMLPRLQRGVRQASRLTGKQVNLEFSGAESLIDSEVLNDIVEPLLHLLRNAVDHGVQPAEERVAAGKPPAGNIHLAFARDGNQILVRCRDDGAGLDYDAIRATAVRNRVISAGQVVSDEQLRRLILRPNFSTRTAVSQTSGRGVGMDVVHTATLHLGGSMQIASEPGQGCTVELRLPLTLISTHALLVKAGAQTLAVANRGVEQILHVGAGEVREVAGKQVLQVDNVLYPLKPLEKVLDLKGFAAQTEIARRPAMLVHGEHGLEAIMVEQVVGSRDMVVKNLGDYLPKLHGVVGATILGDGSVTPVLELPELLRMEYSGSVETTTIDSFTGSFTQVNMPKVLVVDDSLSARRALVQVFEDSGYEVDVARDGMEAAQVLEERKPDLVVTDLEMPRMNGMELTRHVRAQAEHNDVPIIMVTSRTTAKHREQARDAGVNVYLSKPFSEDELLTEVEKLRARTAQGQAA